MLAVIEP